MISENFLPAAMRQQAKRHEALLAAYRDGLGFTLIAVWATAEGIRIAATRNAADIAPAPAARWWCRDAGDAARVAAAATRLLRRRQSQDKCRWAPATESDALTRAAEVIAGAAERIGVTLYRDEDVAREAADVVARVDAEFERLQRAGDLKAINRAYREHRMEAARRGEKILPYARWLDQYREDFVRRLAAGLR